MRVPYLLKPKQLPTQMTESEHASALQTATSIQYAIQSFILVNTAVTLLVSGPLQVILNSVKQLQIILHTLMIELAYPGSVSVFFGGMIELVTFQVYDFSSFYNKALHLDEDSPGNQSLSTLFDLMGYKSLYVVQNFGTLCWTLLITPLLWVVSKFLGTHFNRIFGGYKK